MNSLLLDLRREELLQPRVDVQVGAVVAIGVARFVADPVVRARFVALGKSGEFDFASVDQLDGVARAAWFARHRFLVADATRSTAQLPPEMVEAGGALKARMMKVVEYHLGEDPSAGPRVKAIRPGSGHLDLANDLHALGELYAEYAARIAHDQTFYRSSDGAAAKKMALDMIGRLGGSGASEAERWNDLQSRAFTLLRKVYEEVRRGGLFLFHGDDGEAKFPTLIGASRKSAGGAPEVTAPEEPAPAPATPPATPPAPHT